MSPRAAGPSTRPRGRPPTSSPLQEFEQVYLRNVDVLMGYFARRCRDPQTVADLTSETFVRAYAGMPSDWGRNFTVGAVPVFKYLESRDVDEVGYTLRTASLMTDPEFYFDERDPSDYRLFGIRYLIPPPVAARRSPPGL